MRTISCARFLSILLAFVAFSTVKSQALTIDDFENGDQNAKAIPGQPTVFNTVASSSAIGGHRTLKAQAFSGNAAEDLNFTVQQIIVGPNTFGVLSFSEDTSVTGQGTVHWDGDANDTLDPDGLGGIDLTSDGGTKMRLNVRSFDFAGGNSLDLTIVIYDASDATGQKKSYLTKTLNASVVSATDVDFPFADFVKWPAASAPASISNIGAIELIIGGNFPEFDLSINSFTTNGQCVQIPPGGVLDSCGVCDGGDADKDDCGVCFGRNGDKDDCGVCFGNNNDKDVCGVCFGNGTVGPCGPCGPLPDSCGHCPADPEFNSGDCLDCKGVPNGNAVKDQCDVCEGNGTSCNPCEDFDIEETQVQLDGGAKKQERLARYILSRLEKITDDPATQAYIDAERARAHELQIRNWTISWTFVTIGSVCDATVTNCIQSNNTPLRDEYTEHSLELRALGRKAVAKLKAAQGYLMPKEKRLKRKIIQQHEINMAQLVNVPEKWHQC